MEKKLKAAELERDILKKSHPHFLQEPSMKYRFVKNHASQFPIERMYFILKINSSGYYKWKKRGISNSMLKKNQLKEKIKTLYFEFKQRYESPRITVELHALSYQISRVTIASLV